MEYMDQIKVLRHRQEKLKEVYFRQKGRMNQLELEKDQLQRELQKILNNLELLDQVRILLQKVSELAR